MNANLQPQTKPTALCCVKGKREEEKEREEEREEEEEEGEREEEREREREKIREGNNGERRKKERRKEGKKERRKEGKKEKENRKKKSLSRYVPCNHERECVHDDVSLQDILVQTSPGEQHQKQRGKNNTNATHGN